MTLVTQKRLYATVWHWQTAAVDSPSGWFFFIPCYVQKCTLWIAQGFVHNRFVNNDFCSETENKKEHNQEIESNQWNNYSDKCVIILFSICWKLLMQCVSEQGLCVYNLSQHVVAN